MGWSTRLIIALGALVLGACARETEQKAPEPEQVSAGTFSEIVGIATVSDGDTLRIGSRRVRIDGILAPERRAMCGTVDIYRAATDGLREVTRTGDVRCRISDLPDDQGRDVAQCTVGDRDLGAYMVSHGWARDWPSASGGDYADEEATARNAGRGIWDPSCPADMWRGRDFD